MTQEQLEAIRTRAEEATEGPWLDNFGSFVDGIEIWAKGVCVISTEGGIARYSDTHFIVNAREDIPALLAEIERLNAKLADATSLCLWSARRIHSSYKRYMYDWIDELTGEESERI